jgi:hypothetical protein
MKRSAIRGRQIPDFAALHPGYELNPSYELAKDYFAEADWSTGLPKTLRQPSLKLARCLCMQAVIRSRSGISDEQSRNTSPVQSRRWSSWVKARLEAGNRVRQSARLVINVKFRNLNRSTRIVAPKSIDVAIVNHAVRRVGINQRSYGDECGRIKMREKLCTEFSISG